VQDAGERIEHRHTALRAVTHMTGDQHQSVSGGSRQHEAVHDGEGASHRAAVGIELPPPAGDAEIDDIRPISTVPGQFEVHPGEQLVPSLPGRQPRDALLDLPDHQHADAKGYGGLPANPRDDARIGVGLDLYADHVGVEQEAAHSGRARGA
jgi:hypothetical protein